MSGPWRKALLGVAWLAACSPALAQVNTCQALRLYGNAVNQGLCRSLSPGSQNLWVCELSTGTPDVHLTFNAAQALHLTVRNNPAPPGCEGNATLAGTWPAAGAARLQIAAGQPQALCGVSVANYVSRLNAAAAIAAAGNATACRQGFLAAGQRGRITPALMQSYLALCDHPAPNQPACP